MHKNQVQGAGKENVREVHEVKEVAQKSREINVLQCTIGLKKKVNEKSKVKTNSTHNVKVVCDTCQDDNVKMGNDYKQEEIQRGMLEGIKLHKIIETRAGLDYVVHDMKT